MTHPVTPPPELVAQWTEKAKYWEGSYEIDIATLAARWGADQQLEQCVAWLDGYEHEGWAAEQMRNDCRPKPPSLKDQALTEIERWAEDKYGLHKGLEVGLIRRALEALPD